MTLKTKTLDETQVGTRVGCVGAHIMASRFQVPHLVWTRFPTKEPRLREAQ
jgi:hypothetical protein